MKQEHQVGSLNSGINELQQQAYASMDFLNLEGKKRRDKRLPFNTWNTSELQGNVVGFLFSTFDPPGNPSQGIHYCATPRQTGSVPQATGTGTSFTGDEEQNRSTLPMPTFARRPSAMSSLIPVEVQQNSMVGQQRQQISSELQFDKFPTSSSFLCWVTTCSNFPSEAMIWIKEVETRHDEEKRAKPTIHQ